MKVLELKGNACCYTSQFLRVHGGITDPVFLIGDIVHFYAGPELRMIIKQGGVEYSIGRQGELTVIHAVYNFIVTGEITAETKAQTL
jgi:hypothetical protein